MEIEEFVARGMAAQEAVDTVIAQVTRKPNLILERRDQGDETPQFGSADGSSVAMLTPPISEDYWAYRVRVGDGQAIVAFPKFTTIGIGFAKEEDWNTNLPWTCSAEEIFAHIDHNKGDDSIADVDCIEAIRLIQAAIEQDGGDADWRSK